MLTTILCFANEKGGTGKTMSALCVGYALQQRGLRVLWVDFDPQASLTKSFRYAPPASATIGPLLLKQVQPAAVVVQVAPAGWLIPAGPDLRTAFGAVAAKKGGTLALKELLSHTQGFDFILIDTPGTSDLLTVGALTAAHYVFVPMQPKSYSSDGLATILTVVATLRDGANPGLRIGGFFFAMHNRAAREKVDRAMQRHLERHPLMGPHVMHTTIRRNTDLEQVVTEKANLYEYAPNSPGALDYTQLTGEILARLTP